MAEWKDTVNLPRTDFPMKANLPTTEPQTLERWRAMDLYGKIRARRAADGAPKFVLHDGPPYANGNIHMGTALNKILKELVVKHKSGLDILAGSEQFDRPNAQDAGAIEELLRVLTRTYDYVVIDAGNVINSCVAAALYAADSIFLPLYASLPESDQARVIDTVIRIVSR